MTAPSWHIAHLLARHVACAADEAPVDEEGGRRALASEVAIINVALDCAHGELVAAFGAEAADRIVEDERTRTLCEALLAWHWSTGGAL